MGILAEIFSRICTWDRSVVYRVLGVLEDQADRSRDPLERKRSRRSQSEPPTVPVRERDYRCGRESPASFPEVEEDRATARGYSFRDCQHITFGHPHRVRLHY